ncbi:MAG: phosphatase PAP2 family protein [Burkholderiaceae bacterium]
MTRPSPPTRWTMVLVARARRFFVLKAVGITACTWLFFVGYFHVLRHPAYPVTVVPTTALDHWIPFMPQALIPYISLWVYVGIGPGLQFGFVELLVYGSWACALCGCGLVLFYLWPTQILPTAFDPMGFPGFDLLRGVDAAGNACPSMHVAIAIFTAIRIEVLFRKIGTPPWIRIVNAVWFAAIVYSTLALKQHVVVDVVAGALLGAVFALASLRWRPRGGAPDIIDARRAATDHRRQHIP